MAPDDPAAVPDRRAFARSLAALTALPLLPTPANAQDPPKKDEPKQPPPANPADLLFELLRSRYGQHLTEAELPRVKRSVAGNLGIGRSLAAVKLQNGDDPAVAFRADLP
jgi:hypothetical protein